MSKSLVTVLTNSPLDKMDGYIIARAEPIGRTTRSGIEISIDNGQLKAIQKSHKQRRK